jgi:hypothetical protein
MKRLQNILLALTFVLSIFLHLHGLSSQEFIGDDAAPMLLIDRTWDSIQLKDARFLAYPFLFYNEPYRAVFSGTLLHFFGPDRIILRLPSIIFGLLTFGLLFWIFKKEKITSWLIVISMASYSISPLLINDRSGGGDAQARFFILITGYLVWKSIKENNVKNLQRSLLTWTMGVLTMLDTFALLPGIIFAFFKKRSLINRKTFYLIIGVILFLILYFSAWMILPYFAFKLDFQHYLSNRGFFYYFSRVGEGISNTPLDSIKSLINYTSLLFTLWITTTSLFIFRIKKYLLVNIVNISAWTAVILLSNSSIHIIMYVAFFFFQGVLVTDYAMKKYPIVRIPFILLFVCIVIVNTQNLFTNYFIISKTPPELTFSQNIKCLDTSVVRLYTDHGKTPSKPPCEPATTE